MNECPWSDKFREGEKRINKFQNRKVCNTFDKAKKEKLRTEEKKEHKKTTGHFIASCQALFNLKWVCITVD